MSKRFTSQQINEVLQQANAGANIKDLCRQHGFSIASYYNWRIKYGGKKDIEGQRIRDLEMENAQLKRLLAESILDAQALKASLSRK